MKMVKSIKKSNHIGLMLGFCILFIATEVGAMQPARQDSLQEAKEEIKRYLTHPEAQAHLEEEIEFLRKIYTTANNYADLEALNEVVEEMKEKKVVTKTSAVATKPSAVATKPSDVNKKYNEIKTMSPAIERQNKLSPAAVAAKAEWLKRQNKGLPSIPTGKKALESQQNAIIQYKLEQMRGDEIFIKHDQKTP